MKQQITQQLTDAADRLTRKGLFGRTGDCMSMRIPGSEELLWISETERTVQSASLDDQHDPMRTHAAVYRQRADAGALLFNTTVWSEQLAALNTALPTLFDEPARHIGPVGRPVRSGDLSGLLKVIGTHSNAAVYGTQFLRIGMTADRLTFNVELFEKCAMAFVIARSTGQRIRTVPGWVRYIAGGRLRKDQQRAAESLAGGRLPEGMNAY